MEINTEYIVFFEDYNPMSMTFFINLSLMIGQVEAFEILKIIPKNQTKKSLNELYLVRNSILNYNYVWSVTLLKNNITIPIIKKLLSDYYDYYYLDMININSIVKIPELSFEFMVESHDLNKHKKLNYYRLRLYKIDHFNAYSIVQLKKELVDKILSVLSYNYTDINSLRQIIQKTDEEIRFLQLSRFAFSSVDEFKSNIPIIFNNLIGHEFISPDNFELNEKGEFIINQQNHSHL